ncbi:uncharacterized protein [Ptychodera flava]|uniref:uncharacterized protein n=1 Tax=Ptychodera flava TaxID=63121 RepID=UPI00396A33AB
MDAAQYSDISDYDSDIERFVSQYDKADTNEEIAVEAAFTLTKTQERSRFAAPVSVEDVTKIQHSRVPQNTRRATNWGVTVWDTWGRMRNERIIFALRATDEHSSLQVEQFILGSDSDGCFVEFHGRPCKNNQGGTYSRKTPYKNIRHYGNSSNPRCVVKLIKKYLSQIPPSEPFYLRALPNAKNENIKFSSQKVGVNTLGQYTKQMCTMAGIEGYHTGHSGKVTAATSLYCQGFDEQLIKERTGHRSDEALRAYKRTSTFLQVKISDALQPPSPSEADKDTKTSKRLP